MTPGDWGTIMAYDEYLDSQVAEEYKDQPLAQDWARVGKVAEELGEAIQALIAYTGQNPRKGKHMSREAMLAELADVVGTGLLGIQHFTKDTIDTEQIMDSWFRKLRVQLDRHRDEGGRQL